jgi:hypothetical protein
MWPLSENFPPQSPTRRSCLLFFITTLFSSWFHCPNKITACRTLRIRACRESSLVRPVPSDIYMFYFIIIIWLRPHNYWYRHTISDNFATCFDLSAIISC